MWQYRDVVEPSSLLAGGLFGITRIADGMKTQALRFIESWSAADAYDRFGSAGIGGQEWLAKQLNECGRRAIVAASKSGVIGLLDYVHADGATHVGIVVDARYRKLSVGTTLMRALLHTETIAHPIIAECSTRNYAAAGLLRGCGFEPVGVEQYEITWRHQ